ncbi:MAG TPA: flippase [Bryobacteraceae bacterium]|jgi:O-antigen/teichoic acid export membrane protein|nr:flippase [Bryobacteraceae bacterium]
MKPAGVLVANCDPKERAFSFGRELLSSSLIRNAGWMFGGQVASFGVQAAYFIVLARLLGRTEYGILAGAAGLVNIFSQYSGMGAGLLFLRYVSPDHSRFREYWGNILLSVGIAGTLAITVLVLFGKVLVGRAASGSILILLALGDCFCAQLTSAAAQVFQAFERMRVTAGFNFLTNVLRLLVALAMTLSIRRASAWQWALASLAVSTMACLLAIGKVTREWGPPSFSLRLFFRRLGEGFTFAVSGSATTIYNDVDKVMLGHYGFNAANGIYSMAYRIVNTATMPISSIHAAAFPKFFRDGIRGLRSTAALARKLLRGTTVLAVSAAAGMFLFAPLLPSIAGRDFTGSIAALRWLCLIPLFRCFHLSAGDALAGAGYQKFRLASQLVAAGGNFAINLVLIPKYSWLGAAWASLLTDGSLGMMQWGWLIFLRAREEDIPESAELSLPLSSPTNVL